jgi:hypothetical protein
MLRPGFYEYLLTQKWHFAVFALIAFILVLAATPDGASTSPDSLTYLSTARNLLAGEGYTRFNGEAFTLWPPLYPTLLAGIYGLGDLTGVDPDMLPLLRIINALTFAASIIAAGYLFRRQFNRHSIAFLALGAALFGYPLVYVSAFVWSEALFILLSVVFFLLLDLYRDQPTPRALSGLIVVAALASLQRYPGALLILVGGMALLLMPERPVRQRARHALVFGGIASLPLLLWLVHNYVRADTLTGTRPDSSRSLRTNVSQTYDIVAEWFTPERFGIGYVAAGIIAALLIGLWLVIAYRRREWASWRKLAAARWLPMALYALLYVAFVILSATRVHFDAIDDRLLAPVYVFVIALAFLLVEALLGGIETHIKGGLPVVFVLILLVAWTFYPVNRLRDKIPTLKAIADASRESDRAWHDSGLMERIREADLDGPVYTNAPLPVLLYSGLTVEAVPPHLEDWSPEAAVLVWFDAFPPCNFARKHCIQTDYTPADLAGHIPPEPLLTADDGAVYVLQDR